MERLSLVLEGMGCGGCVKNVRQVLDAVPGVTIENVAVGSAVLAYDPTKSSRQAIIEALATAGYPPREVTGATPETARDENGGHCGIPS